MLAIDVHGELDLVAFPHAAAGIMRRAENGSMDVILLELVLHVLKVHAPYALVVELKRAMDNAVASGFNGLGEADVGGAVNEHRIARLHIGT